MFIFFPPRVLELHHDIGDQFEQIEDVLDRYQDGGIVLLGDQESILDCLKIMEYAKAFPRVMDPQHICL